MKRLYALLLVICMTTILFSGCGSAKKPADDAEKAKVANINLESAFPIVKTPITMKVVCVRPVNGGSTDSLWFWKWAEKKTNIKFDVTQIEQAAWEEKKSIMFASNTLPDIFLYVGLNSDEVMKYGQEQKMLMPLNGLIDKYAPNIKKVLEKETMVKALITCPDNNIYTLPGYAVEPYNTVRAWINDAWIERLGLKQPETLDDLYNVLSAFKTKDPNKNGKADEIPLGGSWKEGYSVRTIVLTALGLNTSNSMSMCVRDGKAVLPEADPAYAEYLKYMNKLYSEGLMDKDIFTQTRVQSRAKAAQNNTGIVLEGAPFLITTKDADWMEYKSLKPLTSDVNSQRMWPAAMPAQIDRFLISSACKSPEAAIRFADLFFTSPEQDMLLYYGPQKGSEDEMGYIGWYMKPDGEIVQDNLPQDANNGWDYKCKYLLPINGNKLGHGVDKAVIQKVTGVAPKQDVKNGFWQATFDERVLPYCDANTTFPMVYFNSKQLARKNQLYTTLSDYASMMEAKFITGAEPIANIDKYYAQLKNLGVDEYVKIFQDVYDQFKKK